MWVSPEIAAKFKATLVLSFAQSSLGATRPGLIAGPRSAFTTTLQRGPDVS
jgi:hypothetical protein